MSRDFEAAYNTMDRNIYLIILVETTEFRLFRLILLGKVNSRMPE
jgi:hypothetical protein